MKKSIIIITIITIIVGILFAGVLYQRHLNEQLVAEYETKIENLIAEYETKIENLNDEHETEVKNLTYLYRTKLDGYNYLLERDDYDHLTTVAYNY